MKSLFITSFLLTFPLIALSEASDYEQFGGALIRKGTGLGKVAIVDCQNAIPHSNFVDVARLFSDETSMHFYAIKSEYENPDTLLKRIGANAMVAVVNTTNTPIMIVAPESHWGVVNLSNIVDDLPGQRAKEKFSKSRARKEVIKCLSLVCGGGSSQFKDNIMNTVRVRELDALREQIPADMLSNYEGYLKRIGVTPKDIVSYEDACQEGWASLPTNGIQKAIWDKVHELPTNPIKIKPETKKVTE